MPERESREIVIDTGEGLEDIPSLNLYEGSLIFNGEQINLIQLSVENALRGTIVDLTEDDKSIGKQVIQKISSVNE